MLLNPPRIKHHKLTLILLHSKMMMGVSFLLLMQLIIAWPNYSCQFNISYWLNHESCCLLGKSPKPPRPANSPAVKTSSLESNKSVPPARPAESPAVMRHKKKEAPVIPATPASGGCLSQYEAVYPIETSIYK